MEIDNRIQVVITNLTFSKRNDINFMIKNKKKGIHMRENKKKYMKEAIKRGKKKH